MRLYTIHTEYIAYLHTIDTRVPLQHKKSVNRPYAGILLTEDNFNYFIPLSSPKEKFKTMKNTRDFIKIDHGNLGALNLNNMVPVPLTCCQMIDIKMLLSSNSVDDVKYGGLIEDQRQWLTTHKDIIHNKALKLRSLYKAEKLPLPLISRCLDWNKLEVACNQYILLSSKQNR